MSHPSVATHPGVAPLPAIRTIGPNDLRVVLQAGVRDFLATPTHVIFLALIYPIVGLVLARVTMGEGLLPLAYPLIAGFALLGPFAAIGLYELSRRREQGLDVSWKNAFDVLRSPSRVSLAVLGIVQLLILVTWVATAHVLYVSLLGDTGPQSIAAFLRQVVGTPAGWTLIVVGNAVGFIFAAVALTLSVVSFPLLLDRDVGAGVAMQTSIRAVMKNPVTMAMWGLIVAAAMFAGSVPFLIGLAVVMPILGHATWHLYRRVVSTTETGPS